MSSQTQGCAKPTPATHDSPATQGGASTPGFGNEFETHPVQGFDEVDDEGRPRATPPASAAGCGTLDQGADAPRSPRHARRQPFTPAVVARAEHKAFRFRTAAEMLPDGLPPWFREKDASGDGQVSMAEFSREWNQQIVADFRRLDLNDDGVVTPREVLPPSTSRATGPIARNPAMQADDSNPRNSPRTAALVNILLLRFDRDGSGALEESEWAALPWANDAGQTDVDRDGRLSAAELAARVSRE